MTLGSWDEGGQDETQREVTGWKLRVWSVRGEDQLLVLQRTGLPPSPSSSSAVPSSLGSINEVQGYTTDPKSRRWKFVLPLLGSA